MSGHPEDRAVDGLAERDHYDRLAAAYDENWSHSPDFLAWMKGQIQQRLRITSDEVAADIGCGTGLFTRRLARLLRPGGRMLVVMLPAQISYPLFEAALQLFEERQPDPADVVGEMRSAGLAAEVTYDGFPLSFPAGRYLEMVRNRYMPLLSAFDDAQLEAGIAEIQRAHPGGQLTFTDTFAFVLGTAV